MPGPSPLPAVSSGSPCGILAWGCPFSDFPSPSDPPSKIGPTGTAGTPCGRLGWGQQRGARPPPHPHSILYPECICFPVPVPCSDHMTREAKLWSEGKGQRLSGSPAKLGGLPPEPLPTHGKRGLGRERLRSHPLPPGLLFCSSPTPAPPRRQPRVSLSGGCVGFRGTGKS